jgi:ankyrin repeat protein
MLAAPSIDPPIELPSAERIQELLFAAARMGRDDMIPDLLRAGAMIEGRDARGYTALILASYNGQASTTRLLLELGADPNAGDSHRGNTALMGISFKGYYEIARILVDRGADVNARNVAGQTAIMTAVLFNQKQIIDLLMDAGADPAVADYDGNTALTLAQIHGRTDLVERFSAVQD